MEGPSISLSFIKKTLLAEAKDFLMLFPRRHYCMNREYHPSVFYVFVKPAIEAIETYEDAHKFIMSLYGMSLDEWVRSL